MLDVVMLFEEFARVDQFLEQSKGAHSSVSGGPLPSFMGNDVSKGTSTTTGWTVLGCKVV